MFLCFQKYNKKGQLYQNHNEKTMLIVIHKSQKENTIMTMKTTKSFDNENNNKYRQKPKVL